MLSIKNLKKQIEAMSTEERMTFIDDLQQRIFGSPKRHKILSDLLKFAKSIENQKKESML